MPPPNLHLQLYTHEFYPKRGGISTYCHEFACAASEFYPSVQLTGPRNACWPESSRAAPYQLNPGTWAGNHNLPALLQCRRELKTALQSPESIHLLAEPASILAYGMLPKSIREQAKVVLTFHGSEVLRWSRPGLARPFAMRALASAHKAVGVSTVVALSAKDAFTAYADKIAAVPNALPHSLIHAQGQPAARPISDQMRLLSVGRIHRRKGFDQLIHAIGKLPQSARTRITLTIVGGQKDASYLTELRQLADQLSVSVDWVLNASDAALREAYAQADAFALTSMPYQSSVEGFGLVYLEAGAYGLPCIAHDVGGVRDAVIDGQTGRLVQPGEIDALAQVMQTWLDDPQQRQQLGANNQAFAQSRTWANVVEETLA